MSTANNGGPAYPFEYHNQTREYQDGFFGTAPLAPDAAQQFAGMTLRDHFAAKAMQAVMIGDPLARINTESIAREAYRIADAMISERSK